MRLLLILLGAAVASVSAASGPVSESAVRSTSASRPRLGSSPSSLTSLPRKRHAAAGAAARAAAGAEADGVDVECGAARRACKPASLRGGRLTPSFAFAVLHNWLYFLSLGIHVLQILHTRPSRPQQYLGTRMRCHANALARECLAFTTLFPLFSLSPR